MLQSWCGKSILCCRQKRWFVDPVPDSERQNPHTLLSDTSPKNSPYMRLPRGVESLPLPCHGVGILDQMWAELDKKILAWPLFGSANCLVYKCPIISNFPCSLTRNAASYSMKNEWFFIPFYQFSLHLTHLFFKVGRMYFSNLGVKGLKIDGVGKFREIAILMISWVTFIFHHRLKTKEDLLYEVPKNIDVKSKIMRSEEMLSSQMLSGIPEVDLGIEAKMRNIEATEEARQKLQEGNKQKFQPTAMVPTNMATNFLLHNRCEYGTWVGISLLFNYIANCWPMNKSEMSGNCNQVDLVYNYRPHTDYWGRLYRPHTDHVETLTDHLSTTYWPHTDLAYRSCNDHIPTDQLVHNYWYVLHLYGKLKCGYYWILG